MPCSPDKGCFKIHVLHTHVLPFVGARFDGLGAYSGNSGGEKAMLLTFRDIRPFQYGCKGEGPMTYHNPHVSLFLACQPGYIAQQARNDGAGLYARFVIAPFTAQKTSSLRKSNYHYVYMYCLLTSQDTDQGLHHRSRNCPPAVSASRR